MYWTVFCTSLAAALLNGFISLFKVDKKFQSSTRAYLNLESEGWCYFSLVGKYGEMDPDSNIVPTHSNRFAMFMQTVEKIRRGEARVQYARTAVRILLLRHDLEVKPSFAAEVKDPTTTGPFFEQRPLSGATPNPECKIFQNFFLVARRKCLVWGSSKILDMYKPEKMGRSNRRKKIAKLLRKAKKRREEEAKKMADPTTAAGQSLCTIEDLENTIGTHTCFAK